MEIDRPVFCGGKRPNGRNCAEMLGVWTADGMQCLHDGRIFRNPDWIICKCGKRWVHPRFWAEAQAAQRAIAEAA